MRFSPLFILLLLALSAYGQTQERVAILNTVDDLDSIRFSDLSYLTNRLRETAVNVLPSQRYGVMTTESIVAFLGSQENARKVCNESSCLAEVGRKVSADYVAQARVGRFGSQFSINFQLYSSKSGNLIGSFTDNSKDIFGLLAIVDEKAPVLFKQMPGTSSGSKPVSPSIEDGIGGVQIKGIEYEFAGEKRYLANISSEPEGATLSFNGVPNSRCAKTPCNAELWEGSVRIIAALEQYEIADTTVSIRQNNQSIRIRMKANFGVLEIKPAYSENIGSGKGWSLTINGKGQSSYENRLSPGNYEVKLSHECYEDIDFKAGINKDRREVFDMAAYAKLKKGGLVLSAERDGKPVSEPVFVNGKQTGETPFSGSVPVCAKIEIGSGREVVNVNLKPNEKVEHTVKSGGGVSGGSFTDSRDGKTYKAVKIGKQIWMAENLNYNASGSKCYGNKESNCQKYGRLYDWNPAKTACPKGWHLPNTVEWDVLMASVGGEKTAGKYLKAKNGWNKNGNGEDKFGFSALPGGGFEGGFDDVGNYGYWWNSFEHQYNSLAYYRHMYYNREYVREDARGRSGHFFSVRCLQD